MDSAGLRDFFKKYNYEVFVFLIFLSGLIFRIYVDSYHLLMVPDYDGYQYVKIAKNLKKGILVKEALNWTPLLPSLIAIFSFLPLPLDVIGSYINIFFGALTVFPIYFLVRNILNSREAGICSILIYAFHPHIAFVNVQVMSETTYIFMVFLFAYLISESIKQNFKIKMGILTGLTGGLIYLGRPEGTLIYLSLSVLIFFIGDDFKRKLKWFFFNITLFLLTIYPYLLFFKKNFGKFVFSGKSLEILPHIRNMMGIPEKGQGYLETFLYDFEKTYNFIKDNLINVWIVSTEGKFIYSLIIIILTLSFLLVIRKSIIGWLRGTVFFISMLLPVVAVLIFKVDHRYLSPTTSVLSVIWGIGVYGLLYYPLKGVTKDIIKISFYSMLGLLLVLFGVYKVYNRFEKEGELNIIFQQERLYKKTGEWLKENIPADSTIVSCSTNYLIAYYAGDMEFQNESKALNEKDVLEILCSKNNRYLIVNEYAVTRYYKDLKYLMNPYSNLFKNSPLYGKILPIYIDDIAGVVVYTCKFGEIK
ncbi:MAG: glycosyltransferase family 39 protein [Proteobacteria bacterium]|nr:glycosyltransferase family 39 protein [Pseudomonadota bacterium]